MTVATNTDRRKNIYFSKENDDLLDYVNSLEKSEQSKYIMRLIREDAIEHKKEQYQNRINALEQQLDDANKEIEQLKLELINSKSSGGALDEEVVNHIICTLADIKRGITSNDVQLKPYQEEQQEEHQLSLEEQFALMEGIDLL